MNRKVGLFDNANSGPPIVAEREAASCSELSDMDGIQCDGGERLGRFKRRKIHEQ